MNVFDLRNRVLDEYHQYVDSFLNIRDERIRDFVNEDLLLAIDTPCLMPTHLEPLKRQVNSTLKEPWAFDPDERLDESI